MIKGCAVIMYVINHSEIQLPQLKKSMLNFSKGLYEYDLIHIPFTQEANQSLQFDSFQFVIAELLRQNYYMPGNVVEPEFEDSIDGKLYLNITFDLKTKRCSFTISSFTDDGEVMAELEIELSNNEYTMLLPVIQKSFGNQQPNLVQQAINFQSKLDVLSQQVAVLIEQAKALSKQVSTE